MRSLWSVRRETWGLQWAWFRTFRQRLTANHVASGDFEPTISTLRGGVENIAIERALSEIDRWEQKLEESGDSQLAPIAENLRQFRALLTADTLDVTAIGLAVGRAGRTGSQCILRQP